MNKKAVWFRVPKVASCSIKDALAETSVMLVMHGKAKDFFKHKSHNHTDFFKFAFVRNPWDRVVSSYSQWKSNGWTDISFEEFCAAVKVKQVQRKTVDNKATSKLMDIPKLLKVQKQSVKKSKKIAQPGAVRYHTLLTSCSEALALNKEELSQPGAIPDISYLDFIGKFENLQADFAYVCKTLNINKNLSHLNATEHKPYTEYYNETTKQMIAEKYANDIKLFNYTFEPQK
jgi:chondroitin 4-sulfotransferase 11